jgi:hypothetical protein
MSRHISKISSGQMHAVLLWGHAALMMLAFGASPLGRLGLRYLLFRTSERESAQAIARNFSRIFLTGGILVTLGVGAGLGLAWGDALLTQGWVVVSVALITIAGAANVAIEDRWLKRLSDADGHAFAAVLRERTPFWAALISPIIWLFILWLMIEKPA